MSTFRNRDGSLAATGLVTTIVATATVVSAIWGFFYLRMSELKDERIVLAESLGEVPASVKELNDSVKSLENKMSPLVLAMPIDELNGRISLGTGIIAPTQLTQLMSEAEGLIGDKKFDLAGEKAKQMEELYQGFGGVLWIQYRINEAKGYKEEANAAGQKLIARLPNDKRLIPIYLSVVNTFLASNEKAKAERFALMAMKLAPTDVQLRNSFNKIFAYTPKTQTNPTSGPTQ